MAVYVTRKTEKSTQKHGMYASRSRGPPHLDRREGGPPRERVPYRDFDRCMLDIKDTVLEICSTVRIVAPAGKAYQPLQSCSVSMYL